MIIKIASTPNPNALKFIAGYRWLEFVWECKSEKDAAKSILAAQLWQIDGIEYMMFGYDFVSITKKSDAIWEILQPEIIEKISDFAMDEAGLFITKTADNLEQNVEEIREFSELEQKIIQVIKEKVQPAIDSHGGIIKFISFENETVWLDMQGACKGCPSSTATLKNGIENLLKFYFPEIKNVDSIENKTSNSTDSTCCSITHKENNEI